jgi:2'-hydroxyisoflavone reductase
MRILVLGGTVFLGRHVAAEALARGHDVSLFTRGVHGRDLFPEAERLIGDRAGDLSALERGEWDAVIDTSGYEAVNVGRAAALLADRAGHYVFVSSCNAYPAWPEEPVDEDSPVWQSDDDDYGPQKAASERAIEAAMPGRMATVRAGLICGPHDNVFRLPWWVRRIAAGGRVPAPGDPARFVQLIDARDLATFMLDLAERRVPGAFNGTAPARAATMRDVMETAVAATG